jgi:plasmid stabilization system protein ParE
MKVSFSLPALADVEEIIDYVGQRSPASARRIGARIDSLAELLTRQPEAGAVTDEPSIRRLVTTPYPYLIFYELLEHEVRIMAVRHGARDPRTMP